MLFSFVFQVKNVINECWNECLLKKLYLNKIKETMSDNLFKVWGTHLELESCFEVILLLSNSNNYLCHVISYSHPIHISVRFWSKIKVPSFLLFAIYFYIIWVYLWTYLLKWVDMTTDESDPFLIALFLSMTTCWTNQINLSKEIFVVINF